jgi:hypothetical protein
MVLQNQCQTLKSLPFLEVLVATYHVFDDLKEVNRRENLKEIFYHTSYYYLNLKVESQSIRRILHGSTHFA